MKIFNLFVSHFIFLPIFIQKKILPENFVYLSDIDTTIIQDIIFSSTSNILGKKLVNYEKDECILTEAAAKNLSLAQKELLDFSSDKLKETLSFKVYDCYRPKDAHKQLYDYFFTNENKMKSEYYPRISKYEILSRKYVTEQSKHSRGSTISIAITSYLSHKYNSKVKRNYCYNLYEKSIDGNLNIGVLHDCFDSAAEYEGVLNQDALSNRKFIDKIMNRFNFFRKGKLFWEYTLEDEIYPEKYFNFSIE